MKDKLRKVYVVGTAYRYADFIYGKNLVDNIKDADIVIFTGGEDVSPEFYGEKEHYTTSTNLARDLYEQKMFGKALSLNKPMVGVCRGSQLLTVLAGGKLIQDVTHHGLYGEHQIVFKDDKSIIGITSTHHQMMNPYTMPEEDYEIVAVANPSRSKHYKNGDDKSIFMPEEPEIVFYPKINALAIQGHPEYMDKDSEAVIKINELITKYFSI